MNYAWLINKGTKPARARLALEALEDRFVPSATATALDLTTLGAMAQSGGAIFEQSDPQPTGCGVIHDFLRIQGHGANGGIEQGYNTDARPVQFDEKQARPFDRSLQLSEVPLVNIGGVMYREFLLGINQSQSSPLLSLDQLQIFVSGSPNLSGYNSGTLGGVAPIYDLAANGNYVALNASLSHGNGSGDMFLYVPDSLFQTSSNPNPYVYLYSQFGATNAANGGFEQWAVRGQASVNASLGSISGTVFDATNAANPVPISTPVTLSLFDANGNLVATTTTTNGNYTFTGLVTGLGNLSTFTVVQTLPSGFETNALRSTSFDLAQPGQQVQNVDFFDFLNPIGNPPPA